MGGIGGCRSVRMSGPRCFPRGRPSLYRPPAGRTDNATESRNRPPRRKPEEAGCQQNRLSPQMEPLYRWKAAIFSGRACLSCATRCQKSRIMAWRIAICFFNPLFWDLRPGLSKLPGMSFSRQKDSAREEPLGHCRVPTPRGKKLIRLLYGCVSTRALLTACPQRRITTASAPVP